jgi:hypothetical protein
MKFFSMFLILSVTFLAGCSNDLTTADTQDSQQVQAQQNQYAKGQPVPAFDWSLERDLVIKLYQLRNQKAATHTVWRSDHGVVEGDCPSYGYGIPYDTSLTNPLAATDRDLEGEEHSFEGGSLATVEQAEPNGLYASKNTSATWVICIGDAGLLEPVYIETKVTVYPGPVEVNYETNRVTRLGKAAVTISEK